VCADNILCYTTKYTARYIVVCRCLHGLCSRSNEEHPCNKNSKVIKMIIIIITTITIMIIVTRILTIMIIIAIMII